MVTDIRVYIAIVMYMVSGVTLMLFNFVFIYRHHRKSKVSDLRHGKWREDILNPPPGHIPELERRLPDTNDLLAYAEALTDVRDENPDAYLEYMHGKLEIFQKLAFAYGKKSSEERAYFAYFAGNFHHFTGHEYTPLLDILISYLNHPATSIYCRTNVVHALCQIGNVQGVVNALQIVNDRELFIHHVPLTDYLAEFSGDTDELAAELWTYYGKWNDYLMLSVARFITRVSGYFKDVFHPILLNPFTDLEIRIAVIRYYGKFPYEPARPLLIEALTENTEAAIVAASSLAAYRGRDTVDALNNALNSTSWNVRFNAAASLFELHEDEEPENEILAYLHEHEEMELEETML